MLVDQYLISNDGEIYEHYEYVVARREGDTGVSPSAFRIALVEDYASRIIGKKVHFCMFDESRFFLMRNDADRNMVLDISIREIAAGEYRIGADLTTAGGVLLELVGRIAVEKQA